MRIVFAGTSAFAVPSLAALVAAGHELALVVTQPDRPGDRLRLTPPPVKVEALQLGVTVFQPERIADASSVERLTRVAPELLVVVAYGQILPARVLAIPTRGAINLHASLLPRHRGASPVSAAILAGDRTSGVSVMLMDEKLDHGPVLTRAEVEIGEEEDALSLSARLSQLGARLLVGTLERLDRLVPEVQDESEVTFAPRLLRSDGELTWDVPAVELDRRVRAFQPWPGVTLPWKEGRVKVIKGRPAGGSGAPGELLSFGPEAVEVACARGSYRLQRVQLPGRRAGDAVEVLANA